MSDPIGEIPVQITGDFSSLQKDLQQAEGVAAKGAQDLANAFNRGASGFESFGKTIGDFVSNPLGSAQSAIGSVVEALGPLGVAAVAAGTAIGILGKDVVDLVLAEGAAAESTSNLANRLNLSFEETKKLSEMAEIAGVGLGGLNKASMNLANALEDTAGSGKKTAAALKDIGLDVAKMTPSLVDVLSKLAEIPDANERISAANAILGRSAVQLEPLLRNFTDLSAAVDALGGQLSGEMVQSLLKADDAADKLGISWRHLKENIAATFAPAVTKGLEFLTYVLNPAGNSTLETQIESLRKEIVALEADSNKASIAVTSMMGGGFTRMGGNGALESMKARLAALTAQQDAEKEAFKRSKEYNAELDKLERESATRKLEGIENAKKLAEAWHKQNLEDIKAEDKAREEAGKANIKLNEEFIKAGKQLEDQDQKTQTTFDKAWYQYILETRKAIGITDEAKHHFGELSEIGVELMDRLPPAIMAAYEADLKLNDAVKKLGIDAKASGTELIAAFDTFAESGKGNLEQIEIAWSKVSGQIEKIGRDNLPLAIAEYQKYIDLLVKHGAAQGQILQAEERLLELVVHSKELRGEAATAEIVALEAIRLKQEALIIQTRALGDAYVAFIRTFEDAFDSLGKGIADAIVHGKSLGDVFKKVGEQIYSDIVHLIVEGAFKQLKAALIENIDLFGKLAGAAKTAAVQLPEGLGKLPGAGGIPGKSSGSTPSTPSTSGSSGGALAKAGDIAGVVSAVSDVISNFQFYAMNKSLDIIVKHTLETVNELRNWRRDAWDQQTNLFYKLDDMWNEIRNVVDVLKLIGVHGGGGEGDTSFLEDFVKLINSRPASVDGSTQALLDAEAKAYNDVIHASDGVQYGLQSLTPQIENLSSAVENARVSFDEISQGVQGAVAPMVKAFEDVKTGFTGYDATPGSGKNAVTSIGPADVFGFHGYDATPGSGHNAIAMITDPNAPKNQSRDGGWSNAFGGDTRPAVTVYAVDPSGRQIANATITGLEERGIRVR